jgi:hypothetical protein
LQNLEYFLKAVHKREEKAYIVHQQSIDTNQIILSKLQEFKKVFLKKSVIASHFEDHLCN